METGLSVGDVMTQRPVRVPKNLAVRDACRIMRDKNIGSLLVTEGETALLGIITEYDILAMVADKRNPDSLSVGDVMATELLTIGPERDVYDALTIMRDNDVRHLPVIHDGRLIGFLTMKDVLKVEPQLFETMLDTIDLREEERKLALRPEMRQEGFCEVCGNFTEHLAPMADHRLACPDCRAQ